MGILRFLGVGDNLELFVQKMTYAKNYNKIIDVRMEQS